MRTSEKIFRNENARAWILMFLAITLHVVDESATNFLSFYDRIVHGLEEHFGFVPLPTFSFEIWLGGLIMVIIIGFALTPVVYRGGKVIRIVAVSVGVLMVLNACGHIGGSLYLGRILPGFWSSPFLLGAAVYLVIRGLKRRGWTRSTRPPSKPFRPIS